MLKRSLIKINGNFLLLTLAIQRAIDTSQGCKGNNKPNGPLN